MSSASPSRRRVVAALALFVAILGTALSAWLTYVKFRRDFLCDGSGCLGGETSTVLSCDQALDSPWSAFLEVPWSLWSAAHAISVALLAITMLRSRGALARVAPDILTGLGGIAVLVSMVLGTYAWRHFDHMCRLCISLYAYSLLVLCAGLYLRRGPRRRPERVEVGIHAMRIATLLLGLLSLQTLLYRLGARYAECPGLAPGLPSMAIVSPVQSPRTALLIFADPSCERCRELHHMLQQPRLRDLLGAVEQRVYLVPRDVCTERWMPAHEFVDAAGNELSNDGAHNNDACIAARVLYCLERRTPGAGALALSAVFQLQTSRAGGPFFTFDALVDALRGAGLLTGDIKPLRACVDGEEVARDIAEAQGYLRDWVQAHGGKLGLPQVFVAPVLGDRLDLAAVEQANDANKLFRILQPSIAEL